MQIPLQQTKKWQKFLEETGETVFFEENSDFTFLAELKSTPLGSYLYIPYGPYASQKNGLKGAYQALKALAAEKNVIFIRIEPQAPENAKFLADSKAKKSQDLNPAETWVLDLTPEKDAILAAMKQNTRNLCRNYDKKGISVVETKNPKLIKELVRMQSVLARNKKIGTFSEKYLRTELEQDFATYYLAYYEKKVIAASLFFDHGDTRYYMQSASDPKYKKLPATIAILASAIFDAKAKGLKKFDFWGIAPEGAPKNHPWYGFTRFKQSFGGEPISYCGTWDIVLNKTKYHAYQLLRKANRIKRKFRR